VSDKLREKIRSLEVDADKTVETFFGGLQNIGTRVRGHAGVVDEDIEPAEPFSDLRHNLFAIACFRHIPAAIVDAYAAFLKRREHL